MAEAVAVARGCRHSSNGTLDTRDAVASRADILWVGAHDVVVVDRASVVLNEQFIVRSCYTFPHPFLSVIVERASTLA